MSTLGGLYNFDNEVVNDRLLLAFGDSLAIRGPDGGDRFRTNPVGMVYRAFHTNRESRREKQPLASQEGMILCWDGRLDNRDELLSLLGLNLSMEGSDAAIVMASYRRWGEEFLPKLIGDFALSLWDPERRTLILARDAVGPRPLFYHVNERRIIWSSELAPLLDFAEIKTEVDDEFIAAYFTNNIEPWMTPFKDVFAAPPGHAVTVENGKVQIRRYWGLVPGRAIRYKKDEEYEEHFRHLFREAVRCRLRVEGPIWASLSGGLDSSAIVCQADDLIRSGEVGTARLETVSYVYDEAASSDERDFIRCIEERRGRAGHHLADGDYPALRSFPDNQEIGFPEVLDCFWDRHQGLCELMDADGARVILTGHGGDEVLGSSPDPSPGIGDHLMQFHLLSLHRELKAWSKARKKPYAELLWRDGILQFLPGKLNSTKRRAAAAKFPPWFSQDFAESTQLRERYFSVSKTSGFRLPTQRDQALGFLSAMKLVSRGPYRSRGCIEASHPFLHRPLIEFLQAIPHEQILRAWENRSLMRRSLQGLVPEKVLKRRTKRYLTEPFLRAIIREWPRLHTLFTNPYVRSYGYINAGNFITAMNLARNGSGEYVSGLMTVISLEFWLRALERRGSSARISAGAD
jgi:asparagine synthase (glutamine-hydrolysing)